MEKSGLTKRFESPALNIWKKNKKKKTKKHKLRKGYDLNRKTRQKRGKSNWAPEVFDLTNEHVG